jgi:hypothetical protein
MVTASASAIAGSTPSPAVIAKTAMPSESTAPRERSMPPVSITMVWPIAARISGRNCADRIVIVAGCSSVGSSRW